MKGKNTMTIIIGLVCVVLTAVMFLQFKTISKIDVTALENMQEIELRKEITNWKTKNEEILKVLEDTNIKIQEYSDKIANNRTASELLTKDLNRLKGIVGLRDVSGSGIIITLTDNNIAKISAEDLMELVNELKLAGAEAISINDERIVYDSYIVNIGNTFIRINGKQGQVSPYVVKAIGNPTYLESGLAKKQYGYIDTRKAEGKTITLERSDNITIKQYVGDINFNEKYIK